MNWLVSYIVSGMELGLVMGKCECVVLGLELTGLDRNWRHLEHTWRIADNDST
jgi:hypothetical protein